MLTLSSNISKSNSKLNGCKLFDDVHLYCPVVNDDQQDATIQVHLFIPI